VRKIGGKAMKRISTLFVAVLTLFAMTACNGASGTRTNVSDDSSPTVTSTEDSGEVQERGQITVWIETASYGWMRDVAAIWEEETGNQAEVVEMTMIDGIYKIALDGPAGIGPDLLTAPHNEVGDKSTQQLFAPIELSEESLSLINAQAIDACTYNDELYVTPLYMSSNLLIYNKDLVSTPPDTWDELIEIIEDSEFDNNGDGSLGFLCNLGDFYNSAGFLWAGGGYLFGDDNTNPDDIGLDSAGSVEGAKCIQQLFNLMPKGMGDRTTANDLMTGLFAEGKVGMIVRGTDVLTVLDEAGINCGLARMPKLPNGNVVANYSGFSGLAMSEFTDNPELATEFLNFIVQDRFAADYFAQSQLVPCNQKFIDEQSESNDIIKAFSEQIVYDVPMAKIIESNQTWEPMNGAMGSIAAGSDPQEALEIAVKQIQDNITAMRAGEN